MLNNRVKQRKTNKLIERFGEGIYILGCVIKRYGKSILAAVLCLSIIFATMTGNVNWRIGCIVMFLIAPLVYILTPKEDD